MYPSISFNDVDFVNKLILKFKANGLVVINDIFSDSECDIMVDNIVNNFIKLCSGIDKNKISETWIPENLPSQTKSGLFQTLVSNLQTIWEIRSNQKIKTIFEILYSNFKQREIKDFIVSGDAINLKPGIIGPYTTKKSRDWAHLDQTIKNDIYKCVQGQVVLTNTTASFVSTPTSHLIFDKIMDELQVDCDDNWLKFNDKQLKTIKKLIDKNLWQIPILSKKGSFIVWSSTLIHSARFQIGYESEKPNDKYFGWRCIVYVCYRPKEEFTEEELKKRIDAFESNKVTNHWSQKIMSKKPGRETYDNKKNNEIKKLLDNPLLVYDILGKPILTIEQQKLIGL